MQYEDLAAVIVYGRTVPALWQGIKNSYEAMADMFVTDSATTLAEIKKLIEEEHGLVLQD